MVGRNGSKSAARKVRYAVVGLGFISQIAMLPAFRHARGSCQLAALVSDDAAKRAKLGKQYNVRLAVGYEDFDTLCRSGEIDAVYIGLPNAMHREFVERAARAGVHVLCDKPLTDNLHDAEAAVEACRRAGVRLMTAYRLHFEPANLAAIELARSGKLGELRYLTAQFSMQAVAPNIRLDRDLGGGPLLDIGTYCINAARNLFRAEPQLVVAQAAGGTDQRFREVPEMVQALLRFPGDRFASFTCSFGATDASDFQLHGTRGRLELRQAFEMTGPKELHVKLGGEHGRSQARRFAARDQFAPLLTHFAQSITAGRDPGPSGEEGLADLRVIEAIERSLRERQEVGLRGADTHGKRPGPAQAQTKPPIRKPELFHAHSPSR